MRTLASLLLSASLPLFLAACGPETDPGDADHRCTLVACLSVVSVNLGGILATYEGALPLTVEACVGVACLAAEVRAAGDAGCSAPPAGTACCVMQGAAGEGLCAARAGGDVTLYLPVPADGDYEGAHHEVTATVRGNDGVVLFSAQGEATLDSDRPNGPGCEPECHGGAVELGP